MGGAIAEADSRPADARGAGGTELTAADLERRAWEDARAKWACAAFLAVLTYVAHFCYAGKFGVYEDDLVVIPMAAARDWHAIGAFIRLMFSSYMHGRPVGHSLWVLIPTVGYVLGGLRTVYVIGSLIVAANVVLFYLLLRRCWGEPVAFLGGLAFCLFPADTSRELLVHTTILQPAVLFSLVAAHCYLSRRFVAAYIMAALVLVTYESPMLPFLLVPLMVGRWDGKAMRRLLLHLAICGCVIAAAVGVRLAIGEQWVAHSSAETASLPLRVLTCLYLGPATSMAQFYECVGFAIHELRAGRDWAIVAVTCGAIAVVLIMLVRRQGGNGAGVRGEVMVAGRPLAIGVAMWSTAYVLAFHPDHYPPTATYGRMTSVHLAAGFGAAIVVAWIGRTLIVLAGGVRMRGVAVGGIAAYFAMLAGFALCVQDGFASAFRDQRAAWGQVLKLCPDLSDGTTVVLEGTLPTHNWFVLPSSWSDPLMLPALVRFPSNWRQPPVLVRANPGEDWTANLGRRGRDLVWSKPPLPGFAPDAGAVIPDGELILLRANKGRIVRVGGDVEILGAPFHLKPVGMAGMTGASTRPDNAPMPADARTDRLSALAEPLSPGPLYRVYFPKKAGPGGGRGPG